MNSSHPFDSCLPGDPASGPFRPPAGASPPESAGDAQASTEGRRERNGFVEAVILVLVALGLALSLKTYVAEAYEVKGKSMEETFHNGQRVVILKSFYEIHRGDIIVFTSPEDASKDLIKRVIGLPGENVRILRGEVFINGKKLEESYAQRGGRQLGESPREERVDSDHYFVLGDNRPDSHDSRYFKAVPLNNVKGKVVARWWPFSEVQSF